MRVGCRGLLPLGSRRRLERKCDSQNELCKASLARCSRQVAWQARAMGKALHNNAHAGVTFRTYCSRGALSARGLWDARTHHKLLYGSRAIGAAAAPAGFHLRRGGGRPWRRAHARAYPLILTDLRGWDRPDFRPRQSYVMLSCQILWFSHHCICTADRVLIRSCA